MGDQNQRKTDLAKIHLAKKQLGMDDDTYRLMLKEVTGCTSSKDLNAENRQKVLAHFSNIGVKFKKTGSTRQTKANRYPGKPHNMNAQLDKIEALLADMKLSWNYANSMAKRMFKIERVAWLKTTAQRQAIITALINEKIKRNLLEFIENAMAFQRLDIREVESWLPESKRKGWKRNINTLKALKAELNSRYMEQQQ